MKPFTHLHVHSHYSLLNALPKIPELVEAAKKDGMTALALTDNGSMYGTIEFYETCKKSGIKPIIGVDAYVATRTRKDKEARIDNRRTRLIIISKNKSGYENLMRLVSDAYLEGFYYKPRVDKETLEKWCEGNICIAPFFNSEVMNALRVNDFEKAKTHAEYYKKLFGDDFYIEITHHPEIEGAAEDKEKLIKFSKENNYKLVAAQDVYYINKDDREAHKTLLSVQNSFGSRDYIENQETNDFSFINTKTANEYFADTPEALDNTEEIVTKCELEIPIGQWKFPNFELTRGETADEELKLLAYEGIKKRQMKETPELFERIEYELKVIKDKGYAKYFLAVADILGYARRNKILTNTRGSAAGSLVSYLAGITIVDPLDLGLPFERFLNPERPSAPDIDMDFADDKRDIVIDYVRQKYGKDHVAQIGTFGTMAARGSVRDTARALGYDYQVGDKISKLIPMGAQGFPMTLDRALDEVPELAELYKKDKEAKHIIDMAKKIEGCARHIGVHAAGVVVSPDPLTNDTPIQYDPKGENKIITQYDMYSVGEDGAGLLKFDFLGLKNLTIMGNTIRVARKLYGEEIDIDRIPLTDKKTYEMLARGETAATFQLNGDGMTRFLKELKPTDIHDINAMVALYRPGPMAFIPDYIERKHNPAKITYIDERFEKILKQALGILIYQDDIMLIAVHIAGYTWGEADKFRKAMGKKIPEIMQEQKEKFSKGCIQKGGLTEKQTQKLWEQIETFAAYGFNKGHTASYGRIAYLTSYLKANYPVLYMNAVLMSDTGDVEKIAEMVNECKRMGIDVLPPDINESFEDFTVVGPDGKNFEANTPEEKIKNKQTGGKEKIRFGLTTIKNFGAGIASEIVEERKNNGKFKTLEEFVSRINSRNFNKKSLEALIKSGALDSLGERGQMLASLEDLLRHNKDIRNGSNDQENLFGGISDGLPHLRLKDAPQATSEEKLSWEKELLGLFITGHPLDRFRDKLQNKDTSIAKTKKNKLIGAVQVVAGHIDEIKEIRTKKGDLMAFIRLADFTDKIEVVIFPKILEQFKDILKPDNCIAVKGKLSERNDELSIIADKAKILA